MDGYKVPAEKVKRGQTSYLVQTLILPMSVLLDHINFILYLIYNSRDVSHLHIRHISPYVTEISPMHESMENKQKILHISCKGARPLCETGQARAK